MSLATFFLLAALAQEASPENVTTIRVEAGSQRQTEGGWVVLEDYVVIQHGSESIQADRVEYHPGQGDLLAEGNVVIESGPTVVTGSRMEYDLNARTGLIHDAVGWTEEDVTFRGRIVEKIGEDKYRLVDGELTTCSQALPVWTVAWSKAVINVGETAQMWNPRVRFKKVPSAYLPYAIFPIKDERSTGFLVPQVSSSRRRGFSGTVGYFWAISRNQDAFFEFDWSEEELALAPEYRYVINDNASGEFQGQWTEIDRGEGDRRREIQARYNHRQDFDNGYRWRVNLNYTSSIDFTRQNSTNPDGSTIRTVVSNTYLTKSWGSYSFTARAEDRQWLDDDQLVRRLPEVELVQNSRQIGSIPLYWSFRSSLSRFSTESTYRTAETNQSFEASPTWERVHFRPEFRVPFSTLPWLDAVARLALEETFYTARIDDDDPEISDGTLSRESGEFALELSGPRLQNFYGLRGEPGELKFQHLIEPFVNWRYAPDVDEVEDVIAFDGIDRRSNVRNPRDPSRDIDRNTIDFGVTTRLLSKRIPVPGEEEPSSREMLSWRIASSYQVNTFRDVTVGSRTERTRLSDLRSDLRWRPTELMTFSLRNTYDVVVDDLVQTAVTGNFRWGGDLRHRWPWTDKQRGSACQYRYCMDLTYNQSRSRLLDTTSETVNFRGAWVTPAERFGFEVDLRHDLLDSEIQTQSYVFKYRNQCLGTRLSYFWNRFGEREVLFTLSLSHIGDFFDFRSTQSR